MKYLTTHTKRIILLASLLAPIFFAQRIFATVNIPESFAQNGIVFYYCDENASSNSNSGYISSICGSTPKEKYWSALRMHLDEIHAAAVAGNSMHEGGYGPTNWEFGPEDYRTAIVNTYGGSFWPHKSWDKLYNNCSGEPVCGGVGAFGITWSLSPYLQHVNSTDPSLIKYFQNPENYSWPGDKALAIIGETDYDKLVEIEVNYVMNEASLEAFKQTSTLEEATDWWMDNYERFSGYNTPEGRQERIDRHASVQKTYDEMKGFTCSGGGGSTTPSSVSSVSYPLSGPTCSSGSGFVHYAQGDPRWANAPFGRPDQSNVSGGGCGPASFAMLATVLLNREITPEETAYVAGDEENNYANNQHVPGGSAGSITKFLADHYGLEYQYASPKSPQEAVDTISNLLKDGWMIHVSGSHGRDPFQSGHFIGIRGITPDGKWLIADSRGGPGGSGEINSFKEWEPIDLVTAGMHYGSINAIRAPGSLPPCDASSYNKSNNSCGGSSSSSSTGDDRRGTTQTSDNPIIQAYLNTDLSGYGLWLPNTKDYHDNCVAFSAWFINYYTNLKYVAGPSGAGYLDRFLSENNFPSDQYDNNPSVYSLASWSVAVPNSPGANHTGIIVGIDEAQNKIWIAEAGADKPWFTGVHDYTLSEFKGKGQYFNLNNYLKPSPDLP